uniref:Oxysterol-binding protein n=1 Tax=Globodera pallida TaxID=36090 RepID=A0A183BSL4_GLOPA
MATPWFELSGKVELRCEQTGYRAEIEFQAKPFFRGKAHQIHGQIFHGARKNAVMQLKGEWNGHIYLKRENAAEFQLFTDVRQKPDVQKECVPVMEQEDRESRKLWRHVTAALSPTPLNSHPNPSDGLSNANGTRRPSVNDLRSLGNRAISSG